MNPSLLVLLLILVFAVIFIGIVPGSPVFKQCPDSIGVTAFLGAFLLLLALSYIFYIYFRFVKDAPHARWIRCCGRFYVNKVDIAFIIVISFFTVVCAVVLGAQGFFMGNTLPKLNGQIRFPGKLHYDTYIRREPNGMIHIIAEDSHDVFFAQGVAAAQDRLFQMEFQRRTTAGTMCKMVGDAALEFDKYFRTFNFYGVIEGDFENLMPATQVGLRAYVDGINAYLESDPPLQMEFHLLGFKPEPWTVEDVLVWGKVLSQDLSHNMDFEYMRYNLLLELGLSPERIDKLFPEYPADKLVILTEEDLMHAGIFGPAYEFNNTVEYAKLREDQLAFVDKRSDTSAQHAKNIRSKVGQLFPTSTKASNSWAIGGNLTASGKPILANDPHLNLRLPMIWMMMHLDSPEFSSIGACFPGVPYIVIGRNKHIAWSVTNNGADVQDLYVVDEDPNDDTKYWADGQLHDYVIRNEVIEIKGQDDLIYQVKETVYGPIGTDVNGDVGKVKLAVKWTSLEKNDTTYDSFLMINRASSWTEFVDALRSLVAPIQNFVYADVEGNIGYYVPGKIPIRKPEHSGRYPVHTNDSLSWTGYIPFDELPHVFNPPKGYIVTANHRGTAANYSHMISREWTTHHRGTRIDRMIREKAGHLTKDDVVDIQMDVVSLNVEEFRPVFERMQTASFVELESNTADWIDKLIEWDGNSTIDSHEATVFNMWYASMISIAEKEVNESFWESPYFWRNIMLDDNVTDPLCTAHGETTCIETAIEILKEVLANKTSEKRWGELHKVTFKHSVVGGTDIGCMWNRYRARTGDEFTVNVGKHNYGTFASDHGPSFRQIVDLSDLDKSFMIYPIGQSGAPHSKFYDNYLEMWLNGEYIIQAQDSANYEVGYELKLESS